MRKKTLAGVSLIAAAATSFFGVGLGATASFAATNLSYGFDGNAHLVVGGGSDTTYSAMIALGDLWNEDNTAPNGTTCSVVTSATQGSGTYPSSPPVADQRSTTQQTGAPTSASPLATNCNHDTTAEAYPAGSSTGIASLNGNNGGTAGTYPYEGTNQNLLLGGAANNGYGTPDFARSSRQPSTSGGNCAGGNELTCDTFWGIASDGVQVFSWNYGSVSRASELQDLSGGLTADDLYQIWNCNITQWSQIPGLSAAVTAAGGTFTDGPIVPWQMNTASGTEKTFQNYIIHNASAVQAVPSTWNIDAQACDRPLHDGTAPFENDTKPILNDAQNNAHGADPAGIVDNAASTQDPANWIWWGSFGLMGAYKYLSSPTLTFPTNPTTYVIAAAPIYNAGTTGGQENISSCSGGVAAEPACTGSNGLTPSSSNILNASYPIARDLYVATPKSSADCPLNTATLTEGGNTYPAGTVCDLTGTPAAGQQADIQVNGATSGSGGAVREFVRFLCRSTAAQQTSDPFSPSGNGVGVNYLSEISTALARNGFTLPPLQSATNGLSTGYQTAFHQAGLGRSNGSHCSVLSIANTTPAP